jgi:hypothetical protein
MLRCSRRNRSMIIDLSFAFLSSVVRLGSGSFAKDQTWKLGPYRYHAWRAGNEKCSCTATVFGRPFLNWVNYVRTSIYGRRLCARSGLMRRSKSTVEFMKYALASIRSMAIA